MIRFFFVCVASLVLSGCATTDKASDAANLPPLPTTAPGHFHFAWKLSGNRAVAPLQVFDDGQNTWLQFPPGQAAPAIFARSPLGDQLLTPIAGQGGLIMVPGVWPQLILRGGSLQSVAMRLPAEDTAPAPAPATTKKKAPSKAAPRAR